MHHKTTIAPFTKEQTAIIKGLAILFIIFHNFFHWMEPVDSMENEFFFNLDHVKVFLRSLVDSPQDFINIIFSYLGHYGVQIFIFISGYGLTRSFLAKERTWGCFMIDRLKKLYPLLLIGIVIFILFKITMSYAIPTPAEWKSMIYKLLFIHLFIPGETMMLCGPWWFFGLIIQLYIFFPLLYKAISKYGFKAFATISVASYLFVYYALNNWKLTGGLTVMQHCAAHFPEFCLGIYLGMKKNLKPNVWAFLLALTTFISGNFLVELFPLTFLSITYIFVYIFIVAARRNPKPNAMRRIIVYIGNISMMLFITHGMFRYQFVCLAKNYGNPAITNVFALSYFLEVFLLSLSVKVVYDRIQRLLNKKRQSGSQEIAPPSSCRFRQNRLFHNPHYVRETRHADIHSSTPCMSGRIPTLHSVSRVSDAPMKKNDSVEMNTTPNATDMLSDLAEMTDPTAAMALPPHIAVPNDNR